MSNQRTNSKKGWVQASQLPQGENGRALCRQCNTEVPKGRYTFCSENCVHEWKIRSSPQYVRKCLRKRDKGICAKCGLDTYQFSKGMRKPLSGESHESWLARCAKIQEEWKPGNRRTLWEADHRQSVVENGGLVGLEGFDTLCLRCHRVKTAELASRRAAERRALKEKK